MKKIAFLLWLLPLFLYAQKGIQSDTVKQDWTFTAGLTLIGNTKYSNYQTKPPLTLNFRYRLKDRHTIRMNIPIARNVKRLGDVHGEVFPTYPSPEALASAILNREVNTSSYNLMRENKYDLFGVSLGYDYNYPLMSNLSFFIGGELSVSYLKTDVKYYEVSYLIASQPNTQTGLSSVFFNSNKARTDNFLFKPIIGLRHQFQRLIIEGMIGYDFLNVNFYKFDEVNSYDVDTQRTRLITFENKSPTDHFNNFCYSLNLQYAF